MVKKAIDKVIEDMKAEAAEDVGTFTVDRWQVAVAAVVLTTAVFVIAL